MLKILFLVFIPSDDSSSVEGKMFKYSLCFFFVCLPHLNKYPNKDYKCFLLFAVTEDHPEVKAIVATALEEAKKVSTSSYGLYTEVLKNRLKEVFAIIWIIWSYFQDNRLFPFFLFCSFLNQTKTLCYTYDCVIDWRGGHQCRHQNWLGARQLSKELFPAEQHTASWTPTRHFFLSQQQRWKSEYGTTISLKKNNQKQQQNHNKTLVAFI